MFRKACDQFPSLFSFVLSQNIHTHCYIAYAGNLPTSLTTLDFRTMYGFNTYDSGVISVMKKKGRSYGFVLFYSKRKAELSYEGISELVTKNGGVPQLQVASPSEKCIAMPTDFTLLDMHIFLWDLKEEIASMRCMLDDFFFDFSDYNRLVERVIDRMVGSTFTVKILSYILHSFGSMSTANSSEGINTLQRSFQGSETNAHSPKRLATEFEPLGPTLLYIGNLPLCVEICECGRMFHLAGNGAIALTKPKGRRYGFVLFSSKPRAEIAIQRLSEMVRTHGGRPKMQILSQVEASIAEASEFSFQEAEMFLDMVDKDLLEGREQLEKALQGIVDQVDTLEEVLGQLLDVYFSLTIAIYMLQTLYRFPVREQQDGPSDDAALLSSMDMPSDAVCTSASDPGVLGNSPVSKEN